MGKAQKILEKYKKEMQRPQVQIDRKVTIQRYKNDIKFFNREINYKQAQLDSGIILERSESKLYNIASFPKDDIKPTFILETEIDVLTQLIKEKQEQIDNMKELEEKENAKAA